MEEMQSFNKETVLRDLRDESEEPGEESYNDSNSKSEGYDTTTTSDLDDEAEKLSYGKTGLLSVCESAASSLSLSLSLFPFAARLKHTPHCGHGVEGKQKNIVLQMVHWVQGDQPFIGKESEQYFSMLMLQEGIMASASVY
ncbi:hypothetical protein GW17_00004354 [Ensete ventricosum]|nr:hypothetical protein GW17_00004354 [Ensete ventricosum]